jgi:hypothetical protein
MNQVRVGSKWKTIDKTFIVTGVLEKDNDLWIYYKNSQTLQEYNCRQEAFVGRFSQIVNEN